MKITLPHLLAFSKCPKKYAFDKQTGIQISSPTDFNSSIVKNIIKRTYVTDTKDSKIRTWDSIKNELNKQCYKNIDINNKQQFQLAYKKSIAILDILYHWYHKYYINNSTDAFVNFPLEVELSNGIIISHTFDLLLLDPTKQVIPVMFNDYGWDPSTLSNNLYVKAQFWLLQKAADLTPKQLYYWTPKMYAFETKIIYNKSNLQNLDRYINFIASGIKYEIAYPAVNEQCTVCPYRDICTV